MHGKQMTGCSERMMSVGRVRHGLENNIKMHLTETMCVSRDLTELSYGRKYYRYFVKTVRNFHFPKSMGISLPNDLTQSLPPSVSVSI
jgi:hypothetical protein